MILCTLEEEIATLIETEILHSNNNNPISISHPLNTPTKEPTIVNNKESEESSEVNEATKNSPPSDNISSNEDT